MGGRTELFKGITTNVGTRNESFEGRGGLKNKKATLSSGYLNSPLSSRSVARSLVRWFNLGQMI